MEKVILGDVSLELYWSLPVQASSHFYLVARQKLKAEDWDLQIIKSHSEDRRMQGAGL